MAAKTFGYGSIVQTSSGANIAQLLSINGPAAEADDVDTTCMDSSSNFRTYAQGLADPGEVEIEGIYSTTAATHRLLNYAFANGTTRAWTIFHGSSTGNSDSITGYVKSVGREIPMDDMIKCTWSIKVSGLPGYDT